MLSGEDFIFFVKKKVRLFKIWIVVQTNLSCFNSNKHQYNCFSNKHLHLKDNIISPVNLHLNYSSIYAYIQSYVCKLSFILNMVYTGYFYKFKDAFIFYLMVRLRLTFQNKRRIVSVRSSVASCPNLRGLPRFSGVPKSVKWNNGARLQMSRFSYTFLTLSGQMMPNGIMAFTNSFLI